MLPKEVCLICAPGTRMSMADRSRSPRRPVKKHVWVKVRGSARAIKIDAKELHDVDALLEAVKDKEKQKLGGVDSGDLQLFQSEEAKDGGYEALQPDLRVTEITGGEEMKKPLYVFFPDAEVATASEAMPHPILTKLDHKLDIVMAFQKKLATVHPVTESVAATQTRGQDWHMKVVQYYDFWQCMVLSQLYGSEDRPKWFKSDPDFRRASGPFPAVAEPLIPKGQEIVGRAWDVDVHEPCNGLLLLRHLERAYQAGKWTMLPVAEGSEAGMFEIYVGDEHRKETIMYCTSVGEAKHRVKVSGMPLTFGMLHGKRVELINKYKANPSLRALFLKAEMAHRVDASFPHPETRMEVYSTRCQKMLQPNWRMWQMSVPDPHEPVIENVNHED